MSWGSSVRDNVFWSSLVGIAHSCLIGAFGIGTSLSNDFKRKSSGGTEKSKALNMVIKLSSVDGKPTVKISDEITKVGMPIMLSAIDV